MRKASYKSRNAPLFQIGGGKSSPTQMRAIAILEKAVLRAIELGRNDVAIEAVKAIVLANGGPHHAMISNCTFQG